MEFSTIFTPMNITLAVLAVASFFFVQGKVRPDLVALCALLTLTLAGVLDASEALAGFSNSVVIMMVGLFVVGAGIFRTGLAKMLSSKILQLAGKNENLLFILVMLVTTSIGAFISNTGTVAVMIPIVMSMSMSANISPKRYLMPMAFASSMGLFTLISTPPNLVIQEAITNAGFEPLTFFSFAPIGFVCVSVGVVVLFFLSKLLVSKDESCERRDKKGKSLRELVEAYNLQERLHRVRVLDDSPLLNKKLSELNITSEYNISILKMLHRDKSFLFKKSLVEKTVGPNAIIESGDILYCNGGKDDIERFVGENHLKLKRPKEKEVILHFQTHGVAEAFILPQSEFINHTIREIRFRDKYNVNVVGIQRNGEYHIDEIKDIKLHAGDALLVRGTWNEIANLGESQNDVVLVGQPLKEAAKITVDQKAPIAAAILISMIVIMAFGILPGVVAVMAAAILMVISGCLRNMEEAYHSINWQSVVLIASMMPMATAFEKTGVSSFISGMIMSGVGDMGPYIVLASIYFCTSCLTMFVSNTATAILLAPIAMQTAVSMEFSPYPFLFAVAVAASMCFASPFSTTPNALVMSAGGYKFTDYVKVGLPLQIIMGIVMVLLLPFLFPFKL